MSYPTEKEVQERIRSALNVLDTTIKNTTNSAIPYERTARREYCSTVLITDQLSNGLRRKGIVHETQSVYWFFK
jgi:hypothetical protein